MNMLEDYAEAAQRWYDANLPAAQVGMLALVLVLSVIAYYFAKFIVNMVIKAVVKKSTTDWDDKIFKSGAFDRIAHVAPGLVILAFAVPLPGDTSTIQRIVNAYLMLVAVSAVNRIIDAVNEIYSATEISKSRPIKGYLQIVKLFLFSAASLVILATLMDKSPVAFISGLGAMTAVLMLVFKDTILSFVASVQIATNDMVRIGDWIEIPKYQADGDVIDIALHTIKIQNWDMTITTVPTHALIEGSFKNWRGMSESGGRRIARSIALDQNSVRFTDGGLEARLCKIELISSYLTEMKAKLDTHNEAVDSSSPVNQRLMTNIGTFRKYLLEYLKEHPDIHTDMPLLVRQLAPTETGVPIELYCFTTTTVWSEYEGIQGDIFDHIMAILPEFDLRVFQAPTGRDFRALGADTPPPTPKAARGG